MREISIEEKLGCVTSTACVYILAMVAATYSMLYQQSVKQSSELCDLRVEGLWG